MLEANILAAYCATTIEIKGTLPVYGQPGRSGAKCLWVIVTEMGCPGQVRFIPGSDLTADIPDLGSWPRRGVAGRSSAISR
jgi:hypothetical protein